MGSLSLRFISSDIASFVRPDQTAEHKITNADFQRHFSHDPRQPKTDLVISAFAFGDVPTDAIRISLLESLWNQTGDVLVLIERGTPVGYKMIVKAREWVLQRENGKGGEEGGAHVVAPCPHDGPCPMLGVSNHDWCHFSQRVQRPEFLMKTKRSKINFEDARYSYVVLRRGKRPVAAMKDEASGAFS
ncbi:mitochondrial small ribosomal subunit Rsm22-domain-containing protein [Jimgerdemannia flammicorona]|uniref:Mitochondrial small ribosomal subunit Rsm22-domain-containing protein n=1 Tax=Jimgerdemannia flammicorona TaxID=994334 RepID=A0A433DC78_9FUNG|nr:mitochondrial small ribosomal subunit Rsm22-domain-containing protein [Jimgerdemannia flammicorona]